MASGEKPLVWLHGQIKTPPFSEEARIEAGYLLGRLQQADAIVILEVFGKTTRQTPLSVIDTCKRRLKHYDSLD